MAEIFLARGVSATGVERYCVLKRILRNRASDVSFVRMFLDEAKLAAHLQHPNVAQVYDIGKLGDSYFFTMEYVHGETVRAIMQRARSLRRDLPVTAVLTIVAGAAAGLHHAHDRIGVDGRPLNIVHRDVSPSNLMVSYEGSVKVVDFGVAKASDRANETRSGTVKGKISYLSPEQARGSSSIDRRSDLFALGIVMWELLAGERLYKRSSDFENMTAIVNEPPSPPSSRKSSVPPELDAITLRLLSKSPADRFQTADELIEAIESFASRSGTMISSSALARFLRDMFGQRPEPWVELDTAEVPEGVTVTSEPIPGELAIPIHDDVDLHLDVVPKLDLEKPVAQIDDDHLLPTPLIGAPPDADQIPTRPHPKIANPMMTTLSDASPPPPRPPMSPVVGAQPAVRPQPALGQTIAGLGSGPLSRVAHDQSGSLSYPRAAATDRLPDDPPKKGVGWQLVTVIAIAAVIGSLTMWLVMRNRGGTAETPPADAAVVAVTPPVQIDAAAPAVAIDAAEVMIDAEVAAVEIDAAPPPEEAKPVEKQPDPVEKQPDPVEKKPDPKRPKKSDIEAAWDEGNYKEIVTRCSKAFPSNADDLRCPVAACKLGNESKARAFLAKIDRGRRRGVISACKNANVDLDEAPPEKKPPSDPKKDCELDPMACQH